MSAAERELEEARTELERLKKELKEWEMKDLARRQFSRHSTKITLYGVAQTMDGTESGPIDGWVRDGEGRESFQTVGEALRLLSFIGWNGVICSYPDGKHRMTRPGSSV